MLLDETNEPTHGTKVEHKCWCAGKHKEIGKANPSKFSSAFYINKIIFILKFDFPHKIFCL
jgi:hypothetical protein